MRSILTMVLALGLAAVPVAQAQQIAVPPPVEAPVRSLAEVPLPSIQVDPATAPEIRFQQEPVAADARRDFSARNALAVVGAVVIVVALIAFLR